MKNKYIFPKEQFLRKIIHFFTFKNIYIFNIWFNRNSQAIFSYLLLYSDCCDMLFWLKYKKKMWSSIDM